MNPGTGGAALARPEMRAETRTEMRAEMIVEQSVEQSVGQDHWCDRLTAIRRLSDEERALCHDLEAAYGNVRVLAGGTDPGALAAAVASTQALVGRLEAVSAEVNPVRGRLRETGTLDPVLRDVWSDTAVTLTRVLALRDEVLVALAQAAASTRSKLMQLGAARRAIGGYRCGLPMPPRVHSRRV